MALTLCIHWFFCVWTKCCLLWATILVVAVIAHTFGVVLSAYMLTVGNKFAITISPTKNDGIYGLRHWPAKWAYGSVGLIFNHIFVFLVNRTKYKIHSFSYSLTYRKIMMCLWLWSLILWLFHLWFSKASVDNENVFLLRYWFSLKKVHGFLSDKIRVLRLLLLFRYVNFFKKHSFH